jgi:signal transduction histidine kinase
MKTSSKIAAGYALLIVMMTGAIAFEILAMHRIQAIGLGLTRVNFRAQINTLQLIHSLDLVDEYCRKCFTIGDSSYFPAVENRLKEFEATLEEVRASGISPGERPEIEKLSDYWRSFRAELRQDLQRLPEMGRGEFPAGLESRLKKVSGQASVVYQAVNLAIKSEYERSNKTGERAESVAWMIAALAIAASGTVLFFITRFIAGRLKHLTEGTRQIAGGQFGYRLQISSHDEFSRLADDFNSMTKQLAALDQMKKDFVSHVSHELKAPLASIRETHQLMLEELPGPLTARQRKLLEINLQCTRRLSSMIGNLLDLSRMEAGMMEYDLKLCDISGLVRTALEEFETPAGEKSLEIKADLPDFPLQATCDSERLLQVLGNLLSNAIKFSPERGRISVAARKVPRLPATVPAPFLRLEADNPGDPFVFIQVADSGPGIAPSLRGRIFEKFRQVHQARAIKGEGVGLGLAICRTIVEAHRGAIWAEENPGGGSVFSVLIPIGSPGIKRHPLSRPL